MSARVDGSRFSTVVWCSACPSWSENVHDLAAGHDVAVEHEARVHPDSRTAEINRFNYRKKLLPLAA